MAGQVKVAPPRPGAPPVPAELLEDRHKKAMPTLEQMKGKKARVEVLPLRHIHGYGVKPGHQLVLDGEQAWYFGRDNMVAFLEFADDSAELSKPKAPPDEPATQGKMIADLVAAVAALTVQMGQQQTQLLALVQAMATAPAAADDSPKGKK